MDAAVVLYPAEDEGISMHPGWNGPGYPTPPPGGQPQGWQPPGLPGLPPPPPVSSRRNPGCLVAVILAVILATIVALLAAVIVIVAVFRHSDDEANESSKRDGPSMLVQKPRSGEAYRVGSTAIYNACSLLSLEDVRQAGLSVSQDQLLMETYPVDQSAADSSSRPSASGVSTCGMFLDDGFVNVEVSQAPYSNMRFLENQLSEWKKTGKTYQAKDAEVVLRNDLDLGDREYGAAVVIVPSAIVEVTVKGRDARDYEKLVRGFVDKVVPRLSEPPVREFALSYEAPYGGQPDPCELLTSADVETVFDVPAEGLVAREAIIADKQLLLNNGSKTFFTETICRRAPSTNKSFSVGEVRLSLDYYRDVNSAEALWQQLLNPEGSSYGPPVVLKKIGDDRARITPLIADDRRLEFRVGRYVVQLDLADKNVDEESPEVIEQRLVPVAEAIAKRLR